jgi:translocator protein
MNSHTLISTTTTTDYIRQGLNLVLSIGQVLASILIFTGAFGNQLFFDNPNEPYFLPADYVFSIWGFIYISAIVYGVYQALPANREHPLLRRIGFPTAFAFFFIMLWSVVTLIDPLRYTIPCFFAALVALIYVIYQISQYKPQLSRNDNLMIVWCLSVFAAWCTAGSIANVTTTLYALGVRDFLMPDYVWAIIMLLAAGGLASFTTLVTRGNTPYALTIIWALTGIAVATVQRGQNIVATVFALLMAAMVAYSVVYARAKNQTHIVQARD